MIDASLIEEVKRAPVNEKIQLIEDLLEAIKNDIRISDKKIAPKPFKVKKFSLGEDINVDRDEMYSERGL